MKLKELLTIIEPETKTNIELNILGNKGLNSKGQFEVHMVLDGTKSRYNEYENYEVNRIEPDYDEYYDEKIISIYLFDNEIFDMKE